MAERMLIAVARRDDGTVSPHAGRALGWVVYEAEPGVAPRVAYTLTLSADTCLHEWHVRPDPERHPLHAVDVAIAGSGGEGVRRQLAARGTRLELTAEPDPVAAVAAWLTGTLPPGLPHDERACLGDGHHEGQHGDQHGDAGPG